MRQTSYQRAAGAAIVGGQRHTAPDPEPATNDRRLSLRSGAADDAVELRRRFAHAIVRPGGNAMLINADNTRAGWCPIDQAAASGRAFAVEVDDDIVAIDSDQRDQRRAVMQLMRTCERAGYPPVLVASGQPGRVHLLARVHDPALRRDLSQRARAAGLDVRAAIRAPLAPHRLGLISVLIEPTDPAEALRRLRRRAPRLFSRAMRPLLVRGDGEHQYRSRSEAVQALALAAVNADWSFAELLRVLLDPRHVGGAKVQEIATKCGQRAAEQYVERSYRRALDRVRARPPIRDRDMARAEIVAIAAAADRAPWRGVAGGTDRAVLQIHIEIAHRIGKLVHGASVRQIAERAGVSPPTVVASHKRLTARGWLWRVRRSRPGRDATASEWRVRVGRARKSLTVSTSVGGCESEC